jgi:hypothetical protein
VHGEQKDGVHGFRDRPDRPLRHLSESFADLNLRHFHSHAQPTFTTVPTTTTTKTVAGALRASRPWPRGPPGSRRKSPVRSPFYPSGRFCQARQAVSRVSPHRPSRRLLVQEDPRQDSLLRSLERPRGRPREVPGTEGCAARRPQAGPRARRPDRQGRGQCLSDSPAGASGLGGIILADVG